MNLDIHGLESANVSISFFKSSLTQQILHAIDECEFSDFSQNDIRMAIKYKYPSHVSVVFKALEALGVIARTNNTLRATYKVTSDLTFFNKAIESVSEYGELISKAKG